MNERWVVVYENEYGTDIFEANCYEHACEIRMMIVKENWLIYFETGDEELTFGHMAKDWHEFTGYNESISVQPLSTFIPRKTLNRTYRAKQALDEEKHTTWNGGIDEAAMEACDIWGKDCQASLEVLVVSETGKNKRLLPTDDEIAAFNRALKEIREGARA